MQRESKCMQIVRFQLQLVINIILYKYDQLDQILRMCGRGMLAISLTVADTFSRPMCV